MDIDLSWNGGSTYTSQKEMRFTTNNTYYQVGDGTDTWGRTWDDAEFSDANLRLRIIHQQQNGYLYVDHLQVKVYYTEAATFSPLPTFRRP